MQFPSYPARPLNGGRFGLLAQRPVHLWSPKLNGWRALVHTPTGTLFNRQGAVQPLQHRMAGY